MNLGIIDYGAGNLRSVAKAVEYCGATAQIIATPREILHMDKIILPGVGAFGHAMSALAQLDLLDALKTFMQSGKPFLGICLGMQVLFGDSEESPGVPGINIFPGHVRRFPNHLKVPHLGWNQIIPEKSSPLFRGVPEEAFFYFAHSYYAHPVQSECIIATTDYQGSYTAATAREPVFGIQFHPEKSQSNGLLVLNNFITL